MCGHRRRAQSSFWLGVAAAVVLFGSACASSADRDGGDDPTGFVGERVSVSEPGFHELPAPPLEQRSRYVGGRPVEV